MEDVITFVFTLPIPLSVSAELDIHCWLMELAPVCL